MGTQTSDESCPKARVLNENRARQQSIITQSTKHHQWECELLRITDGILPFSSAAAYDQNTRDTEGTEGPRGALTKFRKAISNVWQISLRQICGTG